MQLVLRLKEIKFNHDPLSASVDAFNIRKNESEFIQPPEWRRDASINPEDSPAAYGIRETRGNTLTIQADFSCDEHTEGVSIRALDPHTYRDPVNGNLSSLELKLLESVVPCAMGNVLGEVKSKTVTCSNGQRGYRTFDLDKVRIWDTGVGVENIVWRWQYCLRGMDNWIDFAVTTHRIYTALQVPTRPWMQIPHDPTHTQLPWIEVLKYACDWAAGTQNTDDAAAMITRRVNGLGPALVHYAGSPHFTDEDAFDCSSFLQLLHRQPYQGKAVNCDDCAAIVSTFANAVGCDLFQMCIRPIGTALDFQLKKHIRIGLPGWKINRRFLHHQVASEGSCGEEAEIFDACLQLNSVNDPQQRAIPLLPTNLPFGSLTDEGYRFRLVEEVDQGRTQPHPECKRRSVGRANGFPESCSNRQLLETQFGFSNWSGSPDSGGRLFISGFFFAKDLVSSLHLVRSEHSDLNSQKSAIQTFWTWPLGSEDSLLRIDAYETASRAAAREGVMKLLSTFDEPTMTRYEHDGIGEVSFAEPGFYTILFATGNLVFLLRNVGFQNVALNEIAGALNKKILSQPPGDVETQVLSNEVRRFRFDNSDAIVGKKVSILEEPAAPLAPKRFYKFFGDAGEVCLQDKRLVYSPQSTGVNTLRIFGVDEQGSALLQVLELKVRE